MKRDSRVMSVSAEDSVHARDLAIASAACSYCYGEIPKTHFIATNVVEIRGDAN